MDYGTPSVRNVAKLRNTRFYGFNLEDEVLPNWHGLCVKIGPDGEEFHMESK